MNLNFFEPECQEAERKDILFGICDDEDGTKAYTTLEDELKWNATVINPNGIPVAFSAIDACLQIFREDAQMERSCDGMLIYRDNVVFVELKNVRSAWIQNGLDQLMKTISIFDRQHNMSNIKHKRAFLCNRKHRTFEVLDAEQKRRFFDRYRVRINVSGAIKI